MVPPHIRVSVPAKDLELTVRMLAGLGLSYRWCTQLTWGALELGERAALPVGTVLETAGTVSELAGMASEPAGNILEPAGNIVEPARSFLEPAGRGPQAS